MSKDDPFGNYIDDDKTILRPMPGGRKPQAPTQTPSASAAPVNTKSATYNSGMSENLRNQIAHSTRNPMAGAAISLLALVAQLRNTSTHPDVAGLRLRACQKITCTSS